MLKAICKRDKVVSRDRNTSAYLAWTITRDRETRAPGDSSVDGCPAYGKGKYGKYETNGRI